MESFDWTHARAFVASADAGSFSRAARSLGVSQPTVGRQIAALESQLGVVLFERTGRTLTLTEAGRGVLVHARAMERAATDVMLEALGQTEALAGWVTVSCSDLVAAHWLAPVITTLGWRHPKVHIELLATNDVSDLTRREADIAVRHFRPQSPTLIGRKIGEVRAVMFASPAYLERLGPVRTLADLQRARFIGYERSDVMVATLAELGLELDESHFPVVTSSSVTQLALARARRGNLHHHEQRWRRRPGPTSGIARPTHLVGAHLVGLSSSAANNAPFSRRLRRTL